MSEVLSFPVSDQEMRLGDFCLNVLHPPPSSSKAGVCASRESLLYIPSDTLWKTRLKW